jgi:hypothetical protein
MSLHLVLAAEDPENENQNQRSELMYVTPFDFPVAIQTNLLCISLPLANWTFVRLLSGVGPKMPLQMG